MVSSFLEKQKKKKKKIGQPEEVENEKIHHARHFQKLDCGREGHIKVFSYQNIVVSMHF